MVMREFELTRELTFHGSYDDMHEIIERFNEVHEADDEPHIAHWVDESGCDMFALWVDGRRYDFDMSDLINACFSWVLEFPPMYPVFIYDMTWSNGGHLAGFVVDMIIEKLAKSLM